MKSGFGWRWLKRMLAACLILFLILVIFWRWALAPLVGKAISQSLDLSTFSSKEFVVDAVGPLETRLVQVDFAANGWALEAPEIIASYGWEDIQNARLTKLRAPSAILTLDLDPTSKGPALPEVPSGTSSTPQESALKSIFPFDALEVDDLTLILKRSGQERRFVGTLALSEGFTTEAVTWQTDLSIGESIMHAHGTLDTQRTVAAASVQASVSDLPGWLKFTEVTLPLAGVSTDVVALDAQWTRDQTWRVTAKTEKLALQHREDARATLTSLEVQAEGKGEAWTGNGVAMINEGRWQSWQIGEGHLKWSFLPETDVPRHQIEIGEITLQHEKNFSAKASATATTGTETWKGTLALTDPVFSGQKLASVEVDLEGEGEHIIARTPRMSLLDWPMASLQQVIVDFSKGHLQVEGNHIIDYGKGEVYAPVPVTLVGEEGEEGWALKLLAETQPNQRWQAYWKGLGFALNGKLEANWQFPQPAIQIKVTLPLTDVRRNESAVTLMAVSMTGHYDTSESRLNLNLKGKSGDQDFTGGFENHRSEAEGSEINYHFSKLDLPENTLLGAFAGALVQMPMAAFLNAEGKIKVLPDGEVTHRLALKLARGVYHHPERKLAGRGISGEFAIESFSPFVTVDDQRATFTEWRMGELQLNNGKFLYTLGPDGAVLIKEAEASGIGGLLTMQSLAYHPGHPDFESVVTFKKIKLEVLAKLLNFEGNVGGVVSGKLRLRYKDDLLTLPRGSLTLDPDSTAYLRLDSKEVLGVPLAELTEDPQALQIVESALKDLVLNELGISFFDPEKNDYACQIRLKGHSRKEVEIPNSNGGSAIAPIHLNINIEDPSELVRRALNLLVRKQLDTKR